MCEKIDKERVIWDREQKVGGTVAGPHGNSIPLRGMDPWYLSPAL